MYVPYVRAGTYWPDVRNRRGKEYNAVLRIELHSSVGNRDRNFRFGIDRDFPEYLEVGRDRSIFSRFSILNRDRNRTIEDRDFFFIFLLSQPRYRLATSKEHLDFLPPARTPSNTPGNSPLYTVQYNQFPISYKLLRKSPRGREIYSDSHGSTILLIMLLITDEMVQIEIGWNARGSRIEIVILEIASFVKDRPKYRDRLFSGDLFKAIDRHRF